MVCCECQYGVRPTEAERHLKQKHQFDHPAASQVAQAVRKWEQVQQDSQAIEIPHQLDDPLPILPCRTDGLLCQRDAQCQYLVSHMDSMRKHWRAVHQWSQYPRRGRVFECDQAQGQAELEQSLARVS